MSSLEYEKLQEIIADVLNVDRAEVKMDTRFADDLCADSLDVFQIIMALEETFDIEITCGQPFHFSGTCGLVNVDKIISCFFMTAYINSCFPLALTDFSRFIPYNIILGILCSPYGKIYL